MGLEGDGTNSSYGENYPEDIKEKGERISYDIHRMKTNLSQYNLITFGKHMAKKLYINWCDGSSAMPVKLKSVKSDTGCSKFYDIFVSQRADGWLIYCQVFRAVTFLLMLFSVIKNVRNRLSREDILYLNVFGTVLFYLIWEVKSDYSIPFLLLFFCIASDGMDWHRRFLPTVIQRQGKKAALAGVLLSGICGIFLFWNYREWYTQKLYDFTENVAAMNGTKPVKTIEKIGKNHITIIQNIKVDGSFDTIKIYCKKRKGIGTYTVGLYWNQNGQKQCVQEWNHMSARQVKRGQEKDSLLYEEGNKKGYLLFQCGNILEQGDYTLQITPDSESDSMDWYYNSYGEFAYYDGDLFWNDEKQQGELALCITRHRKETYF